MNNLMKIFSANSSAKSFATGYLKYLADLLGELDTDSIDSFVHALESARQQRKTIFVVGNGGSASTASHMANDIGLDVMKKSGTEKPFRIISLTDNIPLITAIGNDEGYENIFLYQLRILYSSGDMLIAISASGNSPNVVAAAKWVKSEGGSVLGLTGFDGGELKELCDIAIHVDTPKGEYGPVEDIHMVIDHLLANYLQLQLAGN